MTSNAILRHALCIQGFTLQFQAVAVYDGGMEIIPLLE